MTAGNSLTSGVNAAGGSTTGAEGARRVLAVLLAFTPGRPSLSARDLAERTGIPLPSMYRYIALLRDTGLLVGNNRGAYHLSPQLISLARAAEAAGADLSANEAIDSALPDPEDEPGEASR